MLRLAFLAMALCAPVASAQSVIDCTGWQGSAQNLVEPWAQFTRSYANGDVRVALLDTVEPAAGAFYVLVLTPPYDELGSRTCGIVAEGNGSVGFAGIDFPQIDAAYDPASGLTLSMPIQRFDADEGSFAAATLSLTINQATGAILARFP